MDFLETQLWAQGNTAGPVPALVTLAQITLMGILVTLTTRLIRSSVTANRATLVSDYSPAFLAFIVNIYCALLVITNFSLRSPL